MKIKLLNWFLPFACIVVLGFGLLTNQQTTGTTENAKIIHTIERLSFGIAPGDLEKVKTIGIENYLQSQLNPQASVKSAPLINYLAQLDTIHKSSIELLKHFYQYKIRSQRGDDTIIKEKKKQQLQKQRRQFQTKVLLEAQYAHLIQAILSPNQLQEVMVDFWFNHFNVRAGKKIVRFWLADYEKDLREHALGNFRDLLGVTAHHPAMLMYLDNELNTDPNSAAARGNKKGLNENYARELMELHTLGVNGGYTQEDVIALAKILTGWGVDRTGNHGDENNFQFDEKRHNYQDKTFLGQVIKGSGLDEGEQALDILANHPATARFISYKLAQYFVADQPPETLVDKLAKKFLDSQGNIKAVLNVLFHSEEFNDPQYYEQKFKTPYQYLVSLVRVSGITSPNLKRINSMLYQLSMPLYKCRTPDGYKNTKQAWLNPDAMLRRISFATEISHGAFNKKQPVKSPQLKVTLGNNFSQTTKNAIKNSPPRLRSALILGSPEMMHK